MKRETGLCDHPRLFIEETEPRIQLNTCADGRWLEGHERGAHERGRNNAFPREISERCATAGCGDLCQCVHDTGAYRDAFDGAQRRRLPDGDAIRVHRTVVDVCEQAAAVFIAAAKQAVARVHTHTPPVHNGPVESHRHRDRPARRRVEKQLSVGDRRVPHHLGARRQNRSDEQCESQQPGTHQALNDRGVKTVMIGTGQTGLIQGARYGVPIDAIPSQFCAGELETTIVNAFRIESPDVILIEGQGALSHPAFSSSSFILRGACPDGVVLQHAPGRKNRCDFPRMTMPTPATEINLIETFAQTKVIGVTINHENMSDAEVSSAILGYENELGIPATDALSRPPEHLVEMVLGAFPELAEHLPAAA